MKEKTRFLVVEDIHLMRDGMVGLLNARGYCVVGEAADGLEAVGHAENHGRIPRREGGHPNGVRGRGGPV